MPHHAESLIVTLHWRSGSDTRASTVVCEDVAPERLLPTLLAGCGLQVADETGQAQAYTLCLGSAEGRPLRRDEPLSAQGARSGGHLWLVDGGATPRRRCLLSLPDGSEATLPSGGLVLTRGWALGLMALLNPAAHQRELELLERRESPYAYLSKAAHCAIVPGPGRRWSVVTGRSDVATLLNSARLFPETPEPLGDGDRLTLGAYGPNLTVSFVEG